MPTKSNINTMSTKKKTPAKTAKRTPEKQPEYLAKKGDQITAKYLGCEGEGKERKMLFETKKGKIEVAPHGGLLAFFGPVAGLNRNWNFRITRTGTAKNKGAETALFSIERQGR